MTKEELLESLNKCSEMYNTEEAHVIADKLLIEYINDPEIKAAFNKVDKWYS